MGRTKSNLLNQLVKQIGVKFSNCKFKGEHTGVKESAKFRGLDVKSTGFQSDHEPLGGGGKDDLFVSLLNHQLPQYTSWK